uniref:Wheel domain-containing protein n=1 Tax=Panagrellus redivivus TaxID=6233 RepID=A0A7E4W3B3_PANRE
MTSEQTSTKKQYTEADRAALAAKMDKDIDDFMETLAARKKDEPKKEFNFDEWCKEIDQHPAFMTDFKPNADGELHPTMQALQSLKYDVDTPEDLMDTAVGHKDEGNKHFKFKKYRWAITAYTEALKLKVPDRKFNAIVYTNRAASNKHLGNFSSGLRDAFTALKFEPLHVKAMLRAAEILSEKDKIGKQTLKLVDEFLSRLDEFEPEGSADAKPKLAAIREVAAKRSAEDDIQRPIRVAKQFEELQMKRKLLRLLKERGVNFKPEIEFDNYKEFDLSELDVNFPHRDTTRVTFEPGTDVLLWPLILQYPETGQTDFMTECTETASIRFFLDTVLSQPAPWDPIHAFTPKTVRVFVPLDIFDDEQVAEVRLRDPLSTAIAMKDSVIVKGLPVLQVYTKEYVEPKLIPVEGTENRYRFLK